MLNQWDPLPIDASVTFAVIRYPTSSPLQVLMHTATDGADITQFVNSVSQTATEATFRVSWHMEMYAAGAQPRANEVIKIVMNGKDLWIGIVQSISDYGEERGVRRMSIVARSRDQSPLWREIKAVTDVYSLGTDIATVIDDVAAFLGLTPAEYVLPDVSGVYTVHTSTQLSEMSSWEMLNIIGQPISYEPFVDAIGRLRYCSRDVTRPASRVLTADRIARVGGGRVQSRVSMVRVKWLDPNLTKSAGQDQALGSVSITAGFFQMVQNKKIYFSDDRTRRAENTRMVIQQSCNSGLLPVATETYSPKNDFHGKITLKTQAWVPALVTGAMVAMWKTGDVGDAIPGSGFTITVGRRIHAIAELTIMTVMASIGTGHYEIWGTPFDYVHAVNTTEAVDDSVPEWALNEEEISNDLIMNEHMAQSVAVRELLYLSRSSSSFSMEMVDDPSIERGDILQLPSGARFYVLGYRREITRGGPHTFSVEGFLV